MLPNPMLGVVFHAIGGFAAGSFYAPIKKVGGWAWESAWMVLGLAAWLVTPWLVAWLTTPELGSVLRESPSSALLYAYLFGLLWGVGGLTFGLTMRYLGVGLGMAVALGLCMTFGTLVPPIFSGEIGRILSTSSGWTVLGGVATCLLGITICGSAGIRKEGELTDEQKLQAVGEFAIGKGIAVAVVSGILSACFAYALAAGKPIGEVALRHGVDPLLQNNASLAVILAGGLTTNGIWCLVLNFKNRSFGDYVTGPAKRQVFNYFMAALAGFIWYNQFFFYGMGETNMGEQFKFSSWSIHMAFIIVFSNLWGIYFHEWKGTTRRTQVMVWLGITILVASTMVIGLGNYLGG